MPYDDADTRWDWRKRLPPAPSFSFFGDPVQQATVGPDRPTAAVGPDGPGKSYVGLGLADNVSPLPTTSTGTTLTTPLQPLKDPLAEPAKGPGYNPAITAPGAKPSDVATPSGVPLAGFHGGQTPEKTFNQKLLDLAKNGDFTGALSALGSAAGGGAKATSGTAPSPHPFQVGQIQQLTRPKDTTGKAEALLKAANGVLDLRAKRTAADEQARYSILNKRTQQDALKGLLG